MYPSFILAMQRKIIAAVEEWEMEENIHTFS
jgi:hypothetical protein